MGDKGPKSKDKNQKQKNSAKDKVIKKAQTDKESKAVNFGKPKK